MRLPRWAATLPLSAALHVALVAAGVAVLRMESAPPVLILDLEAIIAGGAEGPGAGAPAPSAAPRAARPASKRSTAPAEPAPPSRSREPVVAPRAPEAAPPAPPAPAPAIAQPPAPAPIPMTTPDPAPPVPASPVAGGDAGVARAPGAGTSQTAPPAPGSGSASGSSVSPAATPRGGGAGGDAVAALPPGTGSAAGTGVGSEYAGYLARLRQRIQETLRYPPAARRRGVSGTVQLEIAIGADGAIASVAVVASSSHEILDRAALDAARSLPRVPFPADLRARPLTVRLPVVFELQ